MISDMQTAMARGSKRTVGAGAPAEDLGLDDLEVDALPIVPKPKAKTKCKSSAKPKAKSSANPKAKSKANPKAKSKAGVAAAASSKAEPHVRVERSRSQVVARAGFRGPGSCKTFKFEGPDCEPAMKRARAWLRSLEGQ